jgi:hypothetical protein
MKTTKKTTATAVSDSPVANATNQVSALADQLSAAIAVVLAVIPNLQKYDSRQVRRIAASLKFAQGFILPSIDAGTNLPSAAAKNFVDVNAGHLALEYRDQIGPLALRLASYVADLQYTIDSMVAESTVQSLQLYQWAKHEVKQPNGAELQPYVATASEEIKKVTNRRKKATPPPAPPTTPPAGAQTFMAANLPAKKDAAKETLADRLEKAIDDLKEE